LKDSKIIIPAIILLLVVFGVGGFFAGVQYQKSKRPTVRDFQAMRGQFGAGEPARSADGRPQGLGGRFQGQGRPISGEIIEGDEKSITVKLPDGSSRIIFVGETVQINKSAPGTKEDLNQGTQVFVVGSENPDGSLTATSVQIGERQQGL